MTISYDIYGGKIAIYAERYYWTTGWRWAYLKSGFVAVAHWQQPNRHLGIFPEHVARSSKTFDPSEGQNLVGSRFVTVGGFLPTDDENLVNFVRFGRVDKVEFPGSPCHDLRKAVDLPDLDDRAENYRCRAQRYLAKAEA